MRGSAASLVALALAPTAPAGAAYDGPHVHGDPAQRPHETRTLRVCKHDKRCFRTIQGAVDAARRGDTIRVADGVHPGAVRIRGRRKAYVRLVGGGSRRARIASRRRTAVLIDRADAVTVSGIGVRGYRANGILVRDVASYTLRRVAASSRGGAHGIQAIRARGGLVERADVAWNRSAGIRLGATRRQRKPRRTIVRGVRAWGNAVGLAGRGARYVTVARSELFNNGVGLLLRSTESIVVTRNAVFWNNFRRQRAAGLGVLVRGARGTRLHDNRIFGNWLAGAAILSGSPVGNAVTDNRFGRGGADRNGRDLAYDGGGRGNCFAGNVLSATTLPSDGHTLAPCPGPNPNDTDTSVRAEGLRWLDGGERFWIRRPHAPYKGYRPR